MSWKENIIVKCFMNVLDHLTNSQVIPNHLIAADTLFIYICPDPNQGLYSLSASCTFMHRLAKNRV